MFYQIADNFNLTVDEVKSWEIGKTVRYIEYLKMKQEKKEEQMEKSRNRGKGQTLKFK